LQGFLHTCEEYRDLEAELLKIQLRDFVVAKLELEKKPLLLP
jgi:hypothetical protein